MVFAFKYVDDPMLELKRDELMRVWMSERIETGI